MAKRARKRPPRSSLALRWLALGALMLVGLLYVQPARTYLERRDAVAARSARVDALEAERRTLLRRFAYVKSDEAVAREARRVGYVKPGERLFIVKGIPAWRATLARDGR